MNEADKKKLIELLKEGLLAEERAVPIYRHHLESAIFWTGLPKDKVAKFKSILDTLARESTRHKMAVDKILSKLGGGK